MTPLGAEAVAEERPFEDSDDDQLKKAEELTKAFETVASKPPRESLKSPTKKESSESDELEGLFSKSKHHCFDVCRP